ncbi:SDR family NAD(P)-dependent oxidoreductase [Flavobacterium aquidurense]|uniref:SDR family NAD(P)-dependent oxidoreductase n=1 Tax=Flavobacterium aquidurense TaxID=362413 RepID=UPI003723306E
MSTKKSILIVSAGSGLSLSVAEQFGNEGFAVGLISRNPEKLKNLKEYLDAKGIESYTAAGDAGNAEDLTNAIQTLGEYLGGFDVVHYNAAVVKAQDILAESSESLTKEFTVNVANALHTLQITYSDLKQKQGALLLTGGGLALTPSADYGSLSIGKAALRSLAYQLHSRLKIENIHVGLLTVDGLIDPASKTHSPEELAKLFYALYLDRSIVEIHHAAESTHYKSL